MFSSRLAFGIVPLRLVWVRSVLLYYNNRLLEVGSIPPDRTFLLSHSGIDIRASSGLRSQCLFESARWPCDVQSDSLSHLMVTGFDSSAHLWLR